MKRYSFILCVLAVATGVASAQMGPTAIIVQQYTFAPVGIAGGQTMRLNMANVAGGSSVCMGNLSFVNSDGKTMASQDVTVKAGQTMSFSLPTADIPVNGAEVRGFVKVNRQFGPPVATPGTLPIAVPVCSAVMSLEVVDANGETHVVLTNPTLVSGIVPVLASMPPLAAQ